MTGHLYLTMMTIMKTTGVADLKAGLSRFLEQAKGGQEIIITERGVPIAKLAPLSPDEQRKPRRERLARAGLLLLGAGRVRPSLLTAPPDAGARSAVLAALIDERNEGR